MYYRSSPLLDPSGVLAIIVIAAICVLIVALVSINLFVSAAREKGHCKEGSGTLWLIGIFASPIILGLYVCALPDRAGAPTVDAPKQLEDELPQL